MPKRRLNRWALILGLALVVGSVVILYRHLQAIASMLLGGFEIAQHFRR